MECRRLNLGCGTDIRPGWVNLDSSPTIPGVDVVHDLDQHWLPFRDESFSSILARDVLEHVANPVDTLRELHRVLEAGGRLTVRVPHFTSRNNFIDPTHRSRFAIEWFDFFIRDTVRQRQRPYYFDFVFSRHIEERITFEDLTWSTPFQPVLDWFCNLSRRTRVGYEKSPLRVFPADNIVVVLEK
jgi:SAM-dependent methyltransferase